MSRHQCEPLKTFKFNVSDEPNKIDKQAMNSNSQVQNSAKIDVQNANKKTHKKNRLKMLILSKHWKYQVHSLASATIPPYLHNEGKHLIVAELQFTN